jgi:predicted Zn-dependent protease
VDTLAPKSAVDRTAGQVVLARALYLAEHWGEAQTVYTALARQDSSNATYQGGLGAIAARQGNRSEAERIARRLANVRGSHLFGINTYDRARIAALLGEREKAVTLLRDALAQGLRGWSFLGDADIHTEMDFESLRNDPPFLDLVQPRR